LQTRCLVTMEEPGISVSGETGQLAAGLAHQIT
jgi:hypothetical protein